MSEPEQRHIVAAFAFELGKVETVAVRARMLGRLKLVDADLCAGVEEQLGMVGAAEALEPARPPIDLPASPSLSLVKKAPATLAGRKVAILVTDGSDPAQVDALRAAVEKERGRLAVIAPTIGGVAGVGGSLIAADHALASAPSIFFDAVVVAPSASGAQALLRQAAAIDWLRDAYGHLKVIGYTDTAAPLLTKAAIETDEGIVDVTWGVEGFVTVAKGGRRWEREPKLR
jgi:catalase